MSKVTASNRPPRFPSAVYRLKIVDEPKLATSQRTGRKYLTFNVECVGLFNPETKEIELDVDGEEIAGWEFQHNATFLDDGRNIGLEQLHAAVIDGPLEPPSNFELNEQTMTPEGVTYTGLEFYALCESKIDPKLDKNGKPLINPLTGKPVETSFRRINQILTNS